MNRWGLSKGAFQMAIRSEMLRKAGERMLREASELEESARAGEKSAASMRERTTQSSDRDNLKRG